MTARDTEYGLRSTLRSEQQSLVGAPVTVVAGRKLTPDQEAAWVLVKGTVGGVTAEYVGAVLHSLNGKHTVKEPCPWCEERGSQVLRSKALRSLVIHRRSVGVWEPRDKKDRVSVVVRAGATSQLDELPDWLDAA